MTAPSVQVSVQAASNRASVQRLCTTTVAQLHRYENGLSARKSGSVQVCMQVAPLIGGGDSCIVRAEHYEGIVLHGLLQRGPVKKHLWRSISVDRAARPCVRCQIRPGGYAG